MTISASLLAAAQAGDPAAQEDLSAQFERQGDAPQAVAWLAQAAKAGRPSAVGRLGLWELIGYGVPRSPAAGVEKIIAAARTGDRWSLHIASVVHAGGIGTARDIGQAMVWLVALAEAGDERAACQLALLGESPPAMAEAARMGSYVADMFLGGVEIPYEPVDWRAVAESANFAPFNAPIDRRQDREDPPVWLIADLLDPWLCDYVMALSAPVLTRGKVVDESGGESVRAERSNTVMSFGLADSDVILELINMRLADAAGMPPENAEGLGVLHYSVGESYAPHVDYIPETLANAEQLRVRGQRVRTLLVYLNDAFEGGATAFPHLGVAYRPPRGCAMIFDSVKANGSVDPMTLHTGVAPTAGQKWVISKWFRDKALRPGEAG